MMKPLKSTQTFIFMLHVINLYFICQFFFVQTLDTVSIIKKISYLESQCVTNLVTQLFNIGMLWYNVFTTYHLLNIVAKG